MALVKTFGIEDYAQPAGGCCFLTDVRYSAKLADLWRARGSKQYEMDDIMLLKVGRHLRPRPHFKLIVSREESEGNFMRGYRNQFMYLETLSHPGPLTLIDGKVDEQDVQLAARLAARYSKGRDAGRVTMQLTDLQGRVRQLSVVPLPPEQIPAEWYL